MEVAWRGPAELSPRGPVFDMKKKRAWGVDAHKVVQLMMGQLQSADNCTTAMDSHAAADDKKTLDLLGGDSISPGAAASRQNVSDHNGTSTDFLELDPDQPRLPSDWKKCLDLKTGKMSFVNKTTGVTWEKYTDLRKLQPLDMGGVPSLAALEPTTSLAASPRAHEFLRSKRSEILREAKTSSSSSSGGSPRKAKSRDRLQMLSFSTGKQLWNLHLEDTNVSLVKDSLLLAEDLQEERSNLELDLNLTAGGGGSPASSCQQREQSVCTMEMVQRALRRTADQGLDRKRSSELPTAAVTRPSAASPSFSSLSSARSHEPVWSLGSPSTSSSSVISSRSPRLDASQAPALQDDLQQASKIATTSVFAGDSAESKKQATESMARSTTALVMGACTRCLMYLMLDKANPKCPRCGSDALVDFAPMTPTTNAAAAVKRQRVE